MTLYYSYVSPIFLLWYFSSQIKCPTNLWKSCVVTMTLSHPGKPARIAYTHLTAAQARAGLKIFPQEGLRAVCLSPATCLLSNNQQLVHFQLGSVHCIKPVSLYFLQGFPVAPQLSKQQQSPFPLGMGMLLASKNCFNACWVSSVSPKWGAAVRAVKRSCEKAHFLSGQPHSQKTWLQAGALIKYFIFKKPDRDTDCKMGRWVQVAFFWQFLLINNSFL